MSDPPTSYELVRQAKQHVESLRAEGVEWLPLGENRGFAEANNVALRRALAAGARWIALVNSWIAHSMSIGP